MKMTMVNSGLKGLITNESFYCIQYYSVQAEMHLNTIMNYHFIIFWGPRDIRVDRQFGRGIWWLLPSYNYHMFKILLTTVNLKMHDRSFCWHQNQVYRWNSFWVICNLVNLLSKINRPELYISCYTFLVQAWRLYYLYYLVQVTMKKISKTFVVYQSSTG